MKGYNMKYLRVRENTRLFIKGELITEKEFANLKIKPGELDCLLIPKSKIYFWFGARYELKEY